MVNTIVYKKKITRWLEDMNLFSRGEKQHSTHSMRLFVKYCFHHSKIYKFISSRRRVIYHISYITFLSFIFLSQSLLSTDLLGQHPGMFEIVNNFLMPGAYAREKGQFARKVIWYRLPQLSRLLFLFALLKALRAAWCFRTDTKHKTVMQYLWILRLQYLSLAVSGAVWDPVRIPVLLFYAKTLTCTG